MNDAPTTAPVTLTPIAEDSGAATTTQSTLLPNASDVVGDGLTATGLAISAGNGSLVDNGDGTWDYTPAADDDTSVSFSYTITDGTVTACSEDVTPDWSFKLGRGRVDLDVSPAVLNERRSRWRPPERTMLQKGSLLERYRRMVGTAIEGAAIDVVAFPLARSANLIGRQAIAVPMAEHGMDVDAFEHVCANQHPKLVVIIPTLQNPTTAIMPADQRERFAAIARKHNVRIIEDNIYGAHVDGAPPPIASFAPDITFHLSGMSKAVAAGIRAGWVACPTGFTGSIPVAHKMITGGMPFLLAETAARLVLSGAAEAITTQVRSEIAGTSLLARGMP